MNYALLTISWNADDEREMTAIADDIDDLDDDRDLDDHGADEEGCGCRDLRASLHERGRSS